MTDIRQFAKTFSDQTADNSEREALIYLTQLLKLPTSYKKRLEIARTTSFAGQLTLGAWREAFPDFPFLLVIRSSEKTKDLAGWHYFFGTKKGNKATQQFMRMMDAAEFFADNRATVIMVKLPHVTDWCVVHNAAVSESRPSAILRIPLTDGRMLNVERLDSFLDAWHSHIRGYFQDEMGSTD